MIDTHLEGALSEQYHYLMRPMCVLILQTQGYAK